MWYKPNPNFTYSSKRYNWQIRGMWFVMAGALFGCGLAAFFFTEMTPIWPMVALGAICGGLGFLSGRGPHIVINQDGIRNAAAEQMIPWADVAGLRLAHGYRKNRILHIWLCEPEKYEAYVETWVGDKARGTASEPLTFWLDRTNAGHVWGSIAILNTTRHIIRQEK
jgi:hypothetical protein